MPKKSKDAEKLPPYDLKAEREKYDLSQANLAAILFTNQSTVARWEQKGDAPQLVRAFLPLYWKSIKAKTVKK